MKKFIATCLTFCCFRALWAQGPVAVAFSQTFPDSVTTESLNVLINDYDTEGEPFFISATYTPDSALGSINYDASTGDIIFNHTAYTCGLDTFKYLLCDTSRCDTGLVIITVTCPGSIFLPQGFSPNGDGINDSLVFTNLQYFEPATLQVFNRYGTIVYTSTNYQNNWNGADVDSNKPLPDGTYFYVLQLPNGKVYNNYLFINR